MKFFGLLFLSVLLFLGCQQSAPKPQLPTISWTNLDEPPLFLDCPTENATQNWQCFTQKLQQTLSKKLIPLSDSFASGLDTLHVVLKVDTIGQISVLKLAKVRSQKNRELFMPVITKTVAQLPLLQPAFKTNLEVPVQVSWTLPVYLSK